MQRKLILATALSSVLASGAALAQTQTEILNEEGRFGAGSENEHSFEVEAGQTIEVIARGGNIDTTLNATLPNGEAVYNDDYDGLDAGFMRTFTTGGTVNVEVSPLSGGTTTGSYTLEVRALPPAAELDIDGEVDGRLTGGSGDRYQVTGSAGDRIVIDLKSYDFDAYLTVTDMNGNEFTDDDGGDQGYNSRLQYRFAEDGAITITAGSLGSAEGRYTLSVGALTSEQVAEHQGVLDNEDMRAYDGKRFDVYEIEAEAGETLSVMLESDDFDTVVYVSNPDGSNLGRNDDGTDGTNSELIVTAFDSGVHKIYVTALSDSTGNYTLTIYK
jgi:hypothetical protein